LKRESATAPSVVQTFPYFAELAGAEFVSQLDLDATHFQLFERDELGSSWTDRRQLVTEPV